MNWDQVGHGTVFPHPWLMTADYVKLLPLNFPVLGVFSSRSVFSRKLSYALSNLL